MAICGECQRRGRSNARLAGLGDPSLPSRLSIQEDAPFDWHDGVPRFRGIPVECAPVDVAGRSFVIARLADAAALLDEPDYAQRFIDEDRAPYGLELWPGAFMLAEYVHAGDEGRRRNLLELGCGLALTSLVASLRGWRVTASDYEPVPLQFAAYNARINGIAIDEFLLLDWNCPPEDRRFDCILGADVLYQLNHHEPILGCLSRLLAPGACALLADPNRSVADRFPQLAADRGFHVRVLATRGFSPATRTVIDGRIFQLSPPT